MTVNEDGRYSLNCDVAPLTMIAMEYRLVEGMHPDAGAHFEALFRGFMAQAGAEVLLQRRGDGSALAATVYAIAVDEEGDYCPCDVEVELEAVALDILQTI